MDTSPCMAYGSRIDWHTLDPFWEKYNDFETHLNIPSDIGNGLIKKFRFASGLNIFVHDYITYKPFATQSDDPSPSFGFRFCVSDHTKLDFECLKESLVAKTGESGVFYFPEMNGCHENRQGMRIHKILIMVEPSFFLSMLEDETGDIPFQPTALLNADKYSYAPYHSIGRITPSMRMIVEQILHCPYEGLTRRIFIEGKAMELIACKLNQIKPKPVKCESRRKSLLKAGDIDRIRFAEELLTENLSSPPNTIELAKAIGVSRTKLYDGFNHLYGVSPMEYLRLKRIDKARELVRDKKLSMTQIAHILGYSSSSHFSKTFRDFFGMPPSDYRKNEHVKKMDAIDRQFGRML